MSSFLCCNKLSAKAVSFHCLSFSQRPRRAASFSARFFACLSCKTEFVSKYIETVKISKHGNTSSRPRSYHKQAESTRTRKSYWLAHAIPQPWHAGRPHTWSLVGAQRAPSFERHMRNKSRLTFSMNPQRNFSILFRASSSMTPPSMEPS